MTISVDFCIVGSGLSGATIARALHDADREVVVVESRGVVSGNCADAVHPSGQRYSLYGPHSFRTNSDALWSYVRQFGEFIKFEPVVMTRVDGRDENWPITMNYLHSVHGPAHETDRCAGSPDFVGECLKYIPRREFEKFVRGYTEKQWGCSAESLSPELAKRFSVRVGDDRRLMQHKYQGVPKDGYSKWIENMLGGIPVFTNVDYLDCRGAIKHKKKLIYTGAIDAFFNFDLGRLRYRGQQRKDTLVKTDKNVLPTFQTNFPDPKVRALRVVEWKQMWASNTGHSLLTTEFPGGDGLEYPFPDEANRVLYNRYASRLPDDVIALGRLGENKYMDMDFAISNALSVAKRILG